MVNNLFQKCIPFNLSSIQELLVINLCDTKHWPIANSLFQKLMSLNLSSIQVLLVISLCDTKPWQMVNNLYQRFIPFNLSSIQWLLVISLHDTKTWSIINNLFQKFVSFNLSYIQGQLEISLCNTKPCPIANNLLQKFVSFNLSSIQEYSLCFNKFRIQSTKMVTVLPVAKVKNNNASKYAINTSIFVFLNSETSSGHVSFKKSTNETVIINLTTKMVTWTTMKFHLAR